LKTTVRPVRIGWARRDITPDGPCELAGQYYRRVSNGVRDPLYATALAIESAGAGGRCKQVVMVALDIVWVPASLLTALRRRVAHRLKDLDTRFIVVNAIHTHNAPTLGPGLGWLKPVEGLMTGDEYTQQVVARMTEAVEEAWRRRQTARVGFALGQARVGHCRRAWYADGTAEMYGRTDRPDFIGLEAGEDSGVDMMFCWDGRGRLAGVVVNVACPSQVMEATYRVTADVMGEARRQLQERFGSGLFVLPQISAAGDQSPRDLARNYRGAEPDMWHESGAVELGRRIAGAVAEGYERARESRRSRIEFGHVVKRLKLPVWRATAEEYRRATEALGRLQSCEPKDPDSPRAAFNRFLAETLANEAGGGPGPYDSKLHDFVLMKVHKAVITRHRRQDTMRHVPVELHVLRLGDAVLVTNPFELFLDYGSRIRARSPARQTFLVQLACGAEGYLPTGRAVARGGYGATMCSATVGPEGGDVLVEASVKAIRALWKR